MIADLTIFQMKITPLYDAAVGCGKVELMMEDESPTDDVDA